MNREETLKKFNTYSSLFLVLGILDLVLIWLSFGNKDMIALLHGGCSAAASALRILFLVTVVLGVILAVLKFYVGIQGLRQVKGNHNHQLNWWFALALKGPYASSVSRRTEKVCQPHDFLRLRLKALFYYLLFLATRERVDIFFHTYLVICDVLLQLISDVLFYRFFVSSNCIYIISSTPEMSISIFIF